MYKAQINQLLSRQAVIPLTKKHLIKSSYFPLLLAATSIQSLFIHLHPLGEITADPFFHHLPTPLTLLSHLSTPPPPPAYPSEADWRIHNQAVIHQHPGLINSSQASTLLFHLSDFFPTLLFYSFFMYQVFFSDPFHLFFSSPQTKPLLTIV